ncbi:MAG: phage tail tape measure protein [Deltaproteobacteria bacterium]|nr:phage tail tape measure protein [Deltaproteobacteria bacterium]
MLSYLQKQLEKNIRDGVLLLTDTLGDLGDVGLFISTMPKDKLRLKTSADKINIYSQENKQVLTLSGEIDRWEIKGLDYQDAPSGKKASLTNVNLMFKFSQDNKTITSTLTVTADLIIEEVTIPLTGELVNQKQIQLNLCKSLDISLFKLAKYISHSQLLPALPSGVDVFNTVTLKSLELTFGFKAAIATTLLIQTTVSQGEWQFIEGLPTIHDLAIKIHVTYTSLKEGNVILAYAVTIHGVLKIENDDYVVLIHSLGHELFEINILSQTGKVFPDIIRLGKVFGGDKLMSNIQSGLNKIGLGEIIIDGIKIGFTLKPKKLRYITLKSHFSFEGSKIDLLADLYPDFGFSGKLAKNNKLKLKQIGKHCFPEANIFPALNIAEFLLRAYPQKGSYTFDMLISEEWKFQLEKERISFRDLELSAQKISNSFSGTLSGILKIASMDIYVAASSPEDDHGWEFCSDSHSGGQIETGELFEALSKQFGSFTIPKILEELILTDVQVYLDTKSKDFSCSGSIQDDGKISVGNTNLQLHEATLSLNHTQGKTTGEFKASIAIGKNTFDLDLNLPGDFVLRGTLPQIKLKELAKDLCGSFIDVPTGFPEIEFKDSNVSITEKKTQTSTQEYDFSLSANLNQLGSKTFKTPLPVLFEVQKINNQSGFVAGFDLPDNWSPANMWSVFTDIFQDLTFHHTGLILSSLDNPQISLANLKDKSMPSRIVRGVTFFTSLDFSGALLSQIKKLFGNVDTLRMEAVVAKDPNQTQVIASLGGQKAEKNAVSFDGFQLIFMPGKKTVDFKTKAAFKVKKDLLDFQGNADLSLTGNITLALSLSGQNRKQGQGWQNPFGITGLTIDGLGLSVTFNEEGCLVAFEGKIELGDKADGILLDIGASVVDFAAPGSIVAELEPSSPKKGKITLPQLIHTLTSIDLNKAPLLDEISLKDFKFYLIDDPSGFKSPIDPTFVYKPGVTVIADILLRELEASLDIEINPSKGIYAKGYLSKIINLLDVLIISDTSGKKGAHGLIDTSAITTGGSGDYINISGLISLFNIEKQALKTTASKSGFSFSLEYKVAGIEDLKLNCCLKNKTSFSAEGSAKIGVDQPLDIGICHIHLKDYVPVDLGFALSPARFALEVKAKIDIAGEKIGFGFTLKEKFNDLKKLAEETIKYLEEHAEELFKDIAADLDKLLNGVKKGLIHLGDDAGKALKDVYKKTAEETAKLMKDADMAANEVGHALQSAYNFTGDQAAKAMKDVGYAADQVAGALNNVYNFSADQVAVALKGANYTVREVGKGLKSAFNLSAKDAAQALDYAEYGAREISSALKGTFTNSAKDVAKAFKAIEYGAGDVAGALKDVFTNKADEAGKALKAAGYNADQVAGAMKNVFNASAKAVAKFMQHVWGKNGKAVNDVLKGAGYATSEVESVMKSLFNWPPHIKIPYIKAPHVKAPHVKGW